MQYRFKRTLLAFSIAFTPLIGAVSVQADAIADALSSGKASGDFRLRYETVEQDNALKDAKALTLRSRIGYTTSTISHFSGTLEFEDVRVVGGVDQYSAYPWITDKAYSVIADPQVTEVDQVFIQYKTDSASGRYGRQVIALDNQRFIGHVGWRQDRQTFDAFSAKLTAVENLTVSYAYLFQRNRIFGEEADIHSRDHLLNASYKTAFGTATGYGYLLEEDNASAKSFDTYGVRFNGSAPIGDIKVLYTAEYANQEKTEKGSEKFNADYLLAEAGLSISGITAKLGYEVLGSDNGNYGFSTPLATGHKFNGWADQFLNTPKEGLVDTYASLAGKLAGGKLALIYHEFEADESSDTVQDLGSEVDVIYSRGFGKHYNAGIKYAVYRKGDINTNSDKLWVWVGAKF